MSGPCSNGLQWACWFIFWKVCCVWQCRRKPLKLIVTSATLDSEKLSAYFGGCPVLTVPGRQYDVQIVHSAETHDRDYLAAAVDTAIDIHLHQPLGDILVFLTGQAEIQKVPSRPNTSCMLGTHSLGTLVRRVHGPHLHAPARAGYCQAHRQFTMAGLVGGQAVKQLEELVASLPEGACADLLILPLYAAMPLELQVIYTVSNLQMQPDQSHISCQHLLIASMPSLPNMTRVSEQFA